MSADRIVAVEGVSVRLPLARPLWAAGLEIVARDFFVVRVRTEAGRTGHGFVKSRGVRLDAIVAENLAPLLVGADPRRTEAHWRAMMRATLLPGRVGAVLRAIGCVDIALWDLKAQAAGEPLFRFLGGAKDRARAMAVAGYYERDPDDTGPMREDLAALRAAGFGMFKIAGGMLSAAREAPRLAAARAAIGEGAELVVDVNGCWSDLKAALATARDWAAFDLSWIEEPFVPGMAAQIRAFCAQSPVRVGVGDEQGGVSFFRDLMGSGSVDVVRLDTAVAGGITPALRIVAMAEAHGLPVSPHLYHEINVHLAAAFDSVLAVELFPPGGELYRIDRFLGADLRMEGGALVPSGAPGLGLSPDWPGLLAHRI